jgi:ferredoxin
MQEALLLVVYDLQEQGLSVAHKRSVEGRREGEMKVRVDDETCVGDETCVEICPEIFEMDGNVAVAKMEEVPQDLETKCKEAAESCPVEAIIVDE